MAGTQYAYRHGEGEQEDQGQGGLVVSCSTSGMTYDLLFYLLCPCVWVSFGEVAHTWFSQRPVRIMWEAPLLFFLPVGGRKHGVCGIKGEAGRELDGGY